MDKLNRTRRHTMKIVKENFSPFNNWEDSRLKVLMLDVKERILNKDEVLIREKQSQPYIYMLLEGTLRVEKQVINESLNYWPKDKQKSWVEKKLTSNVLFKIMDINPFKMFGERQCIYEHTNPV